MGISGFLAAVARDPLHGASRVPNQIYKLSYIYHMLMFKQQVAVHR